MYGHIAKMAAAEKKGIEAAGGTADVYQYESPNTLPTSYTHSPFRRPKLTFTPESPRRSPKRSSKRCMPQALTSPCLSSTQPS